MKKILYYLCFAVILSCIATITASCSEKSRAINDLEELADDVQQNGNSYGISEWQDVFRQYQSINEVIDKHNGDYSQKQRSRINHARATIKQAAWDALSNTLDLFPGVKEKLLDWYNSLFDNFKKETGEFESVDTTEPTEN
jgi:DNA phosphorothioation-dependent restriction protein DptG